MGNEPRKAVNVAHRRNDAIVAQRASRVLAGLAHDGSSSSSCALDNLTLVDQRHVAGNGRH